MTATKQHRWATQYSNPQNIEGEAIEKLDGEDFFCADLKLKKKAIYEIRQGRDRHSAAITLFRIRDLLAHCAAENNHRRA